VINLFRNTVQLCWNSSSFCWSAASIGAVADDCKDTGDRAMQELLPRRRSR